MTNKKVEETIAIKTIEDRIKQLTEQLNKLETEVYAYRAVIGELNALLKGEEDDGNTDQIITDSDESDKFS